jgi:hypothetical protein
MTRLSRLEALVARAGSRAAAVGPLGEEVVGVLRFNASTPSPSLLYALPVGVVIDRISIRITTPFNSGVRVAIGLAALPLLDVDATLTGQYENRFLDEVVAPDQLLLTFTGIATVGAGVALFKIAAA